MDLEQLKAAIAQLSSTELGLFARWFEEYLADAWDRQIEEDAKAGRLDKLAAQALLDFRDGRCTELGRGGN